MNLLRDIEDSESDEAYDGESLQAHAKLIALEQWVRETGPGADVDPELPHTLVGKVREFMDKHGIPRVE